MPRRSSVSRVRENRTHGLKGEWGTGPASAGTAPLTTNDPRPPEPMRPAAVAAPPRRPPPASERLGRGHGASRGRSRVPRGRDHQRRRGRSARLRGPRAGAGRRDARRGRADRKGRRRARDGRRRGGIRDGAGRAGGCAAERRGRRLQPRGHRLRRRQASAIPTGTRSGSGRSARRRRTTATGS